MSSAQAYQKTNMKTLKDAFRYEASKDGPAKLRSPAFVNLKCCLY